MRFKIQNILILITVLTVVLGVTSKKAVRYDKSSVYKVIKVNGKILFLKTGLNLKTGDAYFEGTALSFASNKDRAAVVNKIKGRCILQPNVKGRATVLPATSNIAPRGNGSVLLNVIDVRNYFTDTCVFVGSVEVTAGKEVFPLNSNSFFYVTYQYGGEKIAKKIKAKDQTLVFKESTIFEIDGVRVPTTTLEMTLYFMREGEPSKLSAFVPVFPSEDMLKSEIEVLLSEISTLSTDKKIDEVITFVGEFYGKPQKGNLSNWLYKNFDLEIKEEINFK